MKIKSMKEQVIEIITGISIEEWEKNNKWLDNYFKNIERFD